MAIKSSLTRDQQRNDIIFLKYYFVVSTIIREFKNSKFK